MIYPALSIYNQDRLSDREFVDNFVARLDLLERMLNSLRHAVREETEHQLIIGQRGMGKSTLLRRVAIGVNSDQQLSEHFAPLQFREEQYNVTSLGLLWRNCAESLAEWCEARGREDVATRLDRLIDSSDWRDAEKGVADLLCVCADLGRRPVLLLDNIDLIIRGLKTQEQWALRRVLQMPNGPVAVGAATQFLEQSGEREAPFYEFFHPHVLEPLSELELLQCMHSLADSRREAGKTVKEILANEPARLRTLYTLTGGNPRVLALIYQLLERSESGTIFADLEGLLDQVTPFYKARIEEYHSSQHRAVIDAIALNWDPITSNKLSKTTNIAITTISTHLDRLKRDGFIEEVSTSGARSGYQLGERFLNIWYLMRHGTRRTRQKLRWLTIFLSKLYSAEELRRMASEARDDLHPCAWHPDFREAVIAAYEELGNSANAPAAWTDEVIDIVEQVPETLKGERAPLARLNAIMGLVRSSQVALQEKNDQEALSLVDAALVKHGGDEEFEKHFPVGLLFWLKGRLLTRQARYDEALAIWDNAVPSLEAADSQKAAMVLASLLRDKAVGLEKLDRATEALAVYDDLVNRFADSSDPRITREVARSLVSKARRLGIMGRAEESLDACEDILRRFGSSRLGKREVTFALTLRAASLGLLRRFEEAEPAFDEALVALSGNRGTPNLLGPVLLGKATLLARADRHADAIGLYNEIVKRFARSRESQVRLIVANARMGKAAALEELGRSEEAVAEYRKVVTAFGVSRRPDLLAPALAALLRMAPLLKKLHRFDEAIGVYDEFLSRARSMGLMELAGEALVSKGDILFDALSNMEAAEDCYHEAVDLLSNSNNAEAARTSLAWLLATTGRIGEAFATRRDVADLKTPRLTLLDAGLELAGDNFGTAAKHLSVALEQETSGENSDFLSDLVRFLKLGEALGYGDKLVEWLEATGSSERYAPVYVGFVAYIRGEKFLLDVNPEVRRPARDIYERLSMSRQDIIPADQGKITRRVKQGKSN
jgi:tetratricopeptide (TPR) repeat protein